MTRYALNPAMPVLSRPDGVVQVGWDPRRAVLVRPPCGLTTAALGRPAAGPAVRRHRSHDVQALADGVDADARSPTWSRRWSTRAWSTTMTARPRTRSASIRIHGRGPAVGSAGQRAALLGRPDQAQQPAPRRASRPRPPTWSCCRIHWWPIRGCCATCTPPRIPHLPVRVRDGAGLVGPLVMPGVTSCLRCADLHRSDRDAALARGRRAAARHRRQRRPGHRAGHRGAGAQPGRPRHRGGARRRANVDRAPHPPSTLDTTLEFDVNTGSTVARRWSRHPRHADSVPSVFSRHG